MIKLNKTLGSYLPSFFEMELAVDRPINLKTMDAQQLSVFIHEYVHFLQDITTSYGLTEIYRIGEYVQSAVNEIYKKPKGTVEVPYECKLNKAVLDAQEFLRTATLGDMVNRDRFEIVDCWEDDFDMQGNLKLPAIKGVAIELSNSDLLTFGAYAVMENMAYIIERHAFKHCATSPDFPYRAAELLAEHIYPEFAQNDLNVLALCDCSLMFSNPAHVFYEMLLQMRDKQWLPSHPQDIYAQLEHAKCGSQNDLTNISTFYKQLATEARKKLHSYFDIPNCPSVSKDYHNWVDNLLDCAESLRAKTPHFFLDLAQVEPASAVNWFIQIVNGLGTPMMKNSNGEYYCLKSSSCQGYNVEILIAFRQLYSMLHFGETACDMQHWCRQSPDVSVSTACKTAPWSRCNDAQLCPVALLWKNWNLSGYTLTTKA